ncbi:MAG: Na+/H+ antiporter NhaA [candidate division Zixibacteria bacterium]|nr:Na+/H+ antiporter NhaA [candidate division Zixibacteria bacterium]
MRLTRHFVEFLESEQASGIVLLLCTVLSISVANSAWGPDFLGFWDIKVGFEASGLHLKHSLSHWINDGLMAIFFLLIGFEIERELYAGELSDVQNALLPVFAAVGGMALPALFYFLINRGTETVGGFGIPMATDIAFSLGVLALLGSRIPSTLKVFLAAFAIVDDLGAILLIALFYGGELSLPYLGLATGVFAGLSILNRLGVQRLSLYLILGVALWYFLLESGIHATISGVLLAFSIPFGRGEETSPSYRLQHFLHKPVAFFVMPVFALANTGIALSENWTDGLGTLNVAGILAGLLVGKPIGILLFTFLAVRYGFSRLPEDVNWLHIVGVGFLGGIGFTMSIFVTLLAFENPTTIQTSKIAILIGSLLAGTIGFLVLRRKTIDNRSPLRYRFEG